MAPQIARKRKSNELEDGPNTPTQSPKPKRMKITQMQKQALLDNLQLEITERARHLRAHYALQCQDLKARIERRINRVPVGMRKMKMVELMAQHAKAGKDHATASNSSKITKVQHPIEPTERPLPTIPEQQQGQQQQKLPSPVRKPVPQLNHPSKSRKRKSSAIHISSDKENTPQAEADLDTSSTAIEAESLPIPKNVKRVKTASTAGAPKRTASKGQKKPATRSKDTDKHTGILSPRSHNSRTLPRSPIKDTHLPPSPTKLTHFAPTSPPKQPQSPQRPASPFKSAATAATSVLSAFAKRGAAAAAAGLRPNSRDKDTAAAAVAAGTLASPTGKMLPPARPALATVTSSSAHAHTHTTFAPSTSPQRSVSQASARSAASEQSTTSTNGTVVMKPTKSTASKQQDIRGRAAVVKKTTAATKTPTVIGEISMVAPLSPKTGNTRGGGVKRAATTAAARATAAVKRAGTLKKVASNATESSATAAETKTTGRVLRKRY